VNKTAGLAKVLTGYGIMGQLNSVQPCFVLDKSRSCGIITIDYVNEGGDVGGNDPQGIDSVVR
jgi:hypothetical protein